MQGTKTRYLICLLPLLLLSVTGCAGPLKMEYAPSRPLETQVRGSGTIFLAPYADARGTDDPRFLGNISSPVSGLYGKKLFLEEEVASLVTAALKRELTDAGFHVIDWTAGGKAHDWKGYLLRGQVKQYTLTIGPRDEITVEIESKLIDRQSGEMIWEKNVAVKDDRYAGVMGNSRRTIALYISNTLSRVLRETIAELASNLPPSAGAPPSEESVEERQKGVLHKELKGRLAITSEPPRSKLSIGDVYYGLTPLTLDLKPGIYDITLRRKGYGEYREKVSIREGATTEMEIELERVD